MDDRDLLTAEAKDPLNLRCSALFLRDHSVLLCRRTDRENTWVLPGGTPHRGEGTAAAARREVAEETGLEVAAERVAFVLETTSWDAGHHLIEIVFVGSERDGSAEPEQREPELAPAFVPLDDLDQIGLRPPIGGYIRGYARSNRSAGDLRGSTAAYLGNVWRPADDEVPPAVPGLQL
jgi:ADP-ribose pyrophosphatase YjhB (NUDIX family)